ncbi:hypothetical protein MFRU_003g00490 [Monilinia fructicola]|nr:hypothetical protein MFRU_003g00490 [Monilinia fructicola]
MTLTAPLGFRALIAASVSCCENPIQHTWMDMEIKIVYPPDPSVSADAPYEKDSSCIRPFPEFSILMNKLSLYSQYPTAMYHLFHVQSEGLSANHKFTTQRAHHRSCSRRGLYQSSVNLNCILALDWCRSLYCTVGIKKLIPKDSYGQICQRRFE